MTEYYHILLGAPKAEFWSFAQIDGMRSNSLRFCLTVTSRSSAAFCILKKVDYKGLRGNLVWLCSSVCVIVCVCVCVCVFEHVFALVKCR